MSSGAVKEGGTAVDATGLLVALRAVNEVVKEITYVGPALPAKLASKALSLIADAIALGSTITPTATSTQAVALSDEQIEATWQALPVVQIHNAAAQQGIDTAYALRLALVRAILATQPASDAAAIRNAALEEAIAAVPGGTVCDPQQVADAIRELLTPSPAVQA